MTICQWFLGYSSKFSKTALQSYWASSSFQVCFIKEFPCEESSTVPLSGQLTPGKATGTVLSSDTKRRAVLLMLPWLQPHVTYWTCSILNCNKLTFKILFVIFVIQFICNLHGKGNHKFKMGHLWMLHGGRASNGNILNHCTLFCPTDIGSSSAGMESVEVACMTVSLGVQLVIVA
jgi:hypothetical protein